MKRYQKVLVGVVAAVVLVIGGIQLYFSFSLDEQLKETLVNRFHKATNDAYDLEVGSLDLEILGRRLQISDIQLTKKKSGSDSELQISLDALNVSGIGFLKVLLDQQLTLREIRIINPDINFTAPPQKTDSNDQLNISQRLSGLTLNMLKNIFIPRFQVQGLSVTYNRADLPVSPYLSFRNGYILLRDITIDSTSLADKRIIPSEAFTATFRDIHYQTADEMYELTADRFDLASAKNSADIQSLELVPKFGKKQFANRVPHEVDRIKISIPKISWIDINFDKLNRSEGFFARQIQIEDPDWDVHRDKHPPSPANNNPPLPQQMLRNIPFPFAIDSLSLSDGNIRYSELQPNAEEEGFIEFANLTATLKHLTNVEEHWQTGQKPTLTVTSDVMDRAQLHANFTFFMDCYQQHVTGSLAPMNMEVLNKTIEPMAFVRIDDGRILGLDFEMNLNEEKSTGSLTLLYEDLKISLLDRESNEETFGNKVTSLLANTFKVKSKNTRDDPRVAEINFERNKTKSVFNYWWKSLLSGLKASIGV